MYRIVCPNVLPDQYNSRMSTVNLSILLLEAVRNEISNFWNLDSTFFQKWYFLMVKLFLVPTDP